MWHGVRARGEAEAEEARGVRKRARACGRAKARQVVRGGAVACQQAKLSSRHHGGRRQRVCAAGANTASLSAAHTQNISREAVLALRERDIKPHRSSYRLGCGKGRNTPTTQSAKAFSDDYGGGCEQRCALR